MSVGTSQSEAKLDLAFEHAGPDWNVSTYVRRKNKLTGKYIYIKKKQVVH